MRCAIEEPQVRFSSLKEQKHKIDERVLPFNFSTFMHCSLKVFFFSFSFLYLFHCNCSRAKLKYILYKRSSRGSSGSYSSKLLKNIKPLYKLCTCVTLIKMNKRC